MGNPAVIGDGSPTCNLRGVPRAPAVPDRVLRVVFAILVLLTVGCRESPAPDRITASGTLEAIEVRVAPTVAGLLLEVHLPEGRSVEKGEVVARIDDRHHRHQIAQAEAVRDLAETHLKLVRLGVREEDIAALRQQVRQAEEGLAQARKDRDRARALVAEGSLPQKVADDAETLVAVREAAHKAALEMLRKARTGARPEEIEAANAQRQQAEAALEALRDRLEDYVVRSPLSGVVLRRHVEAGEVVAAGQPLGVIAALDPMTLRVFVAERDLARIRLGQEVSVRVDSYPDRAFAGRIVFIASEAEFTPKNIQTREERVKTVYAVKIEVPNPDGVLKVGMPADAEIPFAEEVSAPARPGSGD